MDSLYLARQPIYNPDSHIVAYELLYRSTGENRAEVSDNLHATARVLINTLNYIGLNALTYGLRAFVKVDESILADEMLHAISPDHFVLEILESVRITPYLAERIRDLHARGYRFALNHYETGSDFYPRFSPVFAFIDYVKIDLAGVKEPSGIFEVFAPYSPHVIVEKIEDEATLNTAKSYGFSLFQGYYFSKPDLIEKEGFNPQTSMLLDLIYLLKTDAPLEQLHAQFDSSPVLTLNLLKYIRQNETLASDNIATVEEALLLIGRKRLSHWIELMLYADAHDTDEPTRILERQITQRALQRASFMEEVAYTLKRSLLFADTAYITGILSMNEIIAKENYAELLDQISVAPAISAALLKRQGELGAILELAVAVEKNDLGRIDGLLGRLGLTERLLNQSLLNSYQKSAFLLKSNREGGLG